MEGLENYPRAPTIDFFIKNGRGSAGITLFDASADLGVISIAYSDGKDDYDPLQIPINDIRKCQLNRKRYWLTLTFSSDVCYLGDIHGCAFFSDGSLFTEGSVSPFGFGYEAIAKIRDGKRVIWKNPALSKRYK